MIRLLLTTLAIAIFSGCVSSHHIRVDQGVLIEPETLNYLQQGLTQDQVRKLIGPPANVSSFKPNRWEYVFQSTDPNFQADKLKLLSLEFDQQGYLVSWTKPEAQIEKQTQ